MVYLHALRLIALVVDPGYQAAVLEAAAEAGLSPEAVMAAMIKGFVRCRNKMASNEDHRHLPTPRPQFNIDMNRALVAVASPAELKTFYGVLGRKFGVAKTKNLFGLGADALADRFNLAMLMVGDPRS